MENTAFPYFSFTAPKDHLHIRGEYDDTEASEDPYSGSPPHTWRILASEYTATLNNRITSTYVENTLKQFGPLAKIQDHLHMRGEYSKQIPL